ncbi:hypothetical protein [Hoylesella timonensis]|uniref:hypothetical protein n=1 Tax=Hoylesella timonensis TaxID=386414 RepID=UPI00242B844C|nr:hypothetical protein [Hoylesella timonensis]
MNTEDKNISNAAGDRRTYLSPRTEIIKMATSNLVMGSKDPIEIPIDSPGALDANGKQWQGDDLDSWDEETGNYENNWGSGW